MNRYHLSALAILVTITLQACSAVAVAIAVKHVKDKKKETASAEVGVDPKALYEAQLATFQAQPNASILSTDPDTYTIRGMIGDDQVLSTTRPTGGGNYDFRVEALSEDPLGPNESPAVDYEKRVLERLDLFYRIDEIE